VVCLLGGILLKIIGNVFIFTFLASLAALSLAKYKGISWDIKAMGAGYQFAKSLDVNIERTWVICMMLVSVIVASIVCFTGTIGLIGLVSPQLTIMVIVGNDRFLMPASALVVALLLLGADTVARNILSPVMLPVGIMTSFIGKPFFICLLMRKKREFF
jgi:iron complex transport system permease protein